MPHDATPSKFLPYAKLVALAALPIVLLILPVGFFDTGPPICLSRILFKLECLGCGMTRAVMHFHHFELEKAMGFNRGVVVVYPALVVLWGFWVKNVIQKLRKTKP